MIGVMDIMYALSCSRLWSTIRIPSVILLGLFCMINSDDSISGDAEYCELDVFQPKCARNEIILMKSAFYGRMSLGRCIKQNFGYMGCTADVLPIMDGFCSGRHTCSVNANDRSLVSAKAGVCPTDVAGYLAPSYTCVKIQEPEHSNCQKVGYAEITSNIGYISSSKTNNIPGSQACAYRLMTASGRRLNITVLNFPPPPSTDKSSISSSACYEVGTIKEGGKLKTIHKCLNDHRHKQLYLSNGGHVDISVPYKESHDVAGHFLIHYEGTGCADPTVPKNADLSRSNDQARITCKTSKKEWVLKCMNEKWQGDIGECIEAIENGWSFLGLFDHQHPYGTSIVVGIGATLGVLIGGILLYIIIAIFKRCQKSDYVMTYEYTDPSFAHIPTDYHADKSNLLLQDDKLFEQNSNTWGSQRHGNSNTLSRGGTDHSRVPLPPLPNENNTLSYEKPLYNINGNV